MKITQRFFIWLRVINSLIKTFGGVPCNILCAEDTADFIMSGKSLIRFGDGEIGIYRGKSIHYQPYSSELNQAFIKIKETYEKMGDECPYLLALPRKYMKCNGLELCKKRVLVASWAEARLFFKNSFDLSCLYGDAFLFEKKNKEIYNKIWLEVQDREIIFVHNNSIYAREFEATYGLTVTFIECPSKDAFAKIDEIENKIQSVISNIIKARDKTIIQIVISAGPAGKVLAYRLSLNGYQCIDAGHCWDDPLES